MIIVDVLVVLALILAIAAGATRGLFATLATLLGVVAGALAGIWLVPLLGTVLPAPSWRGIALAASAVALLVIGGAVGAAIGAALRRGADRIRLRVLDRLLGAAFAGVAGALALLLAASTVVATGTPLVSSAVASSRVLALLDDVTPEPVDTGIARLRALVIDEGLPRLGELLAPETAPTAPPVAIDDPRLQQAAASVARISGTAYACGTSMTGSGFVAAPDLVVTNAHVLAGVDAPLVELPGARAREGRVVYFDPVDDLAVIAVGDLDAAPLAIVDPLPAGAAAVVMGHPLGGPLTLTPAHVLSVGAAPVADIHDGPPALREVYALAADVQPGNSGGPLLDEAGAVAGVVFARGLDEGRGYAMTTAELRPALDAADAGSAPVDTGDCGR